MMKVWTLGHSTRSRDEFLAVVAAHQIECVLDVRRFPGSRRHPQFESKTLEGTLAEAGIGYRWLESLGGRRSPVRESATAWRHPAFQAYAEHVSTEEFAEGLTELLLISGGLRSAIMCAELLWWRCHRRLIADVLTSLAIPVVHIRTVAAGELHVLSEPARIVGGQLTYDLTSGKSTGLVVPGLNLSS
jgi:uncharacterized protein (DUF488 family)